MCKTNWSDAVTKQLCPHIQSTISAKLILEYESSQMWITCNNGHRNKCKNFSDRTCAYPFSPASPIHPVERPHNVPSWQSFGGNQGSGQ